MVPILNLRHVFVSRGDAPVLHDIHLTLGSGEHLAILGPNGCGKSTLLKTITCELYPLACTPTGERPTVEIFGRSRWDLTDLRRRLGFVSPDLPGKATLTTSGFDAILTGFFSSSTLWPNLRVTEPMRARAELLLRQVGAENLRHKPVGEMSAGQQRRIMIARALAGSRAAAFGDQLAASSPPLAPSAKEVASVSATPLVSQRSPAGPPSAPQIPVSQMLLLDEPSNGLDLAAQVDLRNLLRDLARQGTAILLITHYTADIIPEIDRVLLMQEGRILADGPKSSLLNAPTLSQLFGTPIELTERNGFFHTW